MRKFLIFLLITLFSVVVVNAQSAEKISALLKTQQITKGQAAYLAATFKNLVGEDASEEDAFKILSENKYFSEKESCDELITLGKVSALFAKAVEFKGGLFYSITHNSRYSYRELKAKGILPSEADPSFKVSGRDAIVILDGLSSIAGGTK